MLKLDSTILKSLGHESSAHFLNISGYFPLKFGQTTKISVASRFLNF